MQRSKKSIILITMIVVTLCVLLGVIIWANAAIAQRSLTSSESEPDYRYHFSLVVGKLENPYWDMVYEGAKKEAVEEDIVIELTGVELAEEYNLLDRLKMAICSKVDGIFVVPDGTQTVNDWIKTATEKYKIPVISIMENDSASGRAGYVGINSYEQGLAYGKLVAELYENKGCSKVVLLRTNTRNDDDDSEQSGDLIYSSIIEYLNRNELSDDVEISVKHINQSSVFNIKRDIQLLISRDDAPDVIICTDYLFTTSTCQVLVDRNKVGKVNVIGSYISEDILDYIQKGTLYCTVAVDPYELGRICVSEMVELKEAGRTNDYMPLEMMLIKSDNVTEYKQKYLEVDD